MHDSGWRFKSPTNLARVFGDIGWRSAGSELHLIAMAAIDLGRSLGGDPGPAARTGRSGGLHDAADDPQPRGPCRRLTATQSLTDTWSLQGNLYVRGFQQHHVDGNLADTERCSNSASPQFRDHLCLQDDGFPRPNPVTTAFRDQFAILDQNNNPIPCPPGSGNTCGTTPYGTIDRTATRATTVGGSLQATNTGQVFEHGNTLVVGGSIDRSTVGFVADSTLGFVNPDLTTTINPAIPGNGAIIHTLSGIGYAPLSIDTRNTYYGAYALDTFDLAERLSPRPPARASTWLRSPFRTGSGPVPISTASTAMRGSIP